MDYKPQQASPSLCRNGCGFYSTNDNDGLCSLCFKEKLKKEADSQSPPTTSSSTQTPPSTGTSSGPSTPSSQSFSSPQASLTSGSTSAPDSAPESSTSSTSSTSTIVSCEAASSHTSSPKKTLHPLDEDSDPVPVKKPKKNRCVSCKKKLGLTGTQIESSVDYHKHYL
jgi:hypothetical protein